MFTLGNSKIKTALKNISQRKYDCDVFKMEVNSISEICKKEFQAEYSKMEKFSFNKGYLEFTFKDQAVIGYFEIQGFNISLIIAPTNNVYGSSFIFNVNIKDMQGEVGYVKNSLLILVEEDESLHKKIGGIGKALCEGILVANYLAQTNPTIIKDSETRIVKKSNKKGKHKNKTIRKINLTNIRHVKEYSNTNINTDKRNYERHTESWTVRGHYRHYKSGKVVWIEPSTRGTGKPQGKVYNINVE